MPEATAYQRMEQALASGDYTALVREIPYANYLAISVQQTDVGLQFHLPFREDLLGNTRLGALHGGVVASFLEISAQLQVLISQNQRRVPGPIDFAVDYLRSAKSQESMVNCRVLRQGSRVAQVQAECWQTDPATPVATARVNFLLQDLDEKSSQ